MTVSEALAVIDRVNWSSVSTRALSLEIWTPPVRASVRRKRGERFETMLIRGAQLFERRFMTGWQDPYRLYLGMCEGCDTKTSVRRRRRLKLTLCDNCARGLRDIGVTT